MKNIEMEKDLTIVLRQAMCAIKQINTYETLESIRDYARCLGNANKMDPAKIRETSGVTIEELAHNMGVTIEEVLTFENAPNKSDAETVLKFCVACGCCMNDVDFGEEKEFQVDEIQSAFETL